MANDDSHVPASIASSSSNRLAHVNNHDSLVAFPANRIQLEPSASCVRSREDTARKPSLHVAILQHLQYDFYATCVQVPVFVEDQDQIRVRETPGLLHGRLLAYSTWYSTMDLRVNAEDYEEHPQA